MISSERGSSDLAQYLSYLGLALFQICMAVSIAESVLGSALPCGGSAERITRPALWTQDWPSTSMLVDSAFIGDGRCYRLWLHLKTQVDLEETFPANSTGRWTPLTGNIGGNSATILCGVLVCTYSFSIADLLLHVAPVSMSSNRQAHW